MKQPLTALFYQYGLGGKAQRLISCEAKLHNMQPSGCILMAEPGYA